MSHLTFPRCRPAPPFQTSCGTSTRRPAHRWRWRERDAAAGRRTRGRCGLAVKWKDHHSNTYTLEKKENIVDAWCNEAVGILIVFAASNSTNIQCNGYTVARGRCNRVVPHTYPSVTKHRYILSQDCSKVMINVLPDRGSCFHDRYARTNDRIRQLPTTRR